MKRMNNTSERDDGFTLIELLVVILIIGILASIAIPNFLNQRKSAVDATTISNVRNIAHEADRLFLKKPTEEITKTKLPNAKTNAETLWDIKNGDKGYCIFAWNPGGDRYSTEGTASTWSSASGGLNRVNKADCLTSIGTPAGSGTAVSSGGTLAETIEDVYIDAQTNTTSIVPLNLLDKVSGGSGTYTVIILNTNITYGELYVGGAVYNSSSNNTSPDIGFKPQSNTATTQDITLKVRDSDGTETAPETINIFVRPIAVDDSLTTTVYTGDRTDINNQNNNAVKINVGTNDKPNNFGGTVVIDNYSQGAVCGTLLADQPDLQNGIIRWLAPATPGTCTIKYQIRSTQNNMKSNIATVTITVQ